MQFWSDLGNPHHHSIAFSTRQSRCMQEELTLCTIMIVVFKLHQSFGFSSTERSGITCHFRLYIPTAHNCLMLLIRGHFPKKRRQFQSVDLDIIAPSHQIQLPAFSKCKPHTRASRCLLVALANRLRRRLPPQLPHLHHPIHQHLLLLANLSAEYHPKRNKPDPYPHLSTS